MQHRRWGVYVYPPRIAILLSVGKHNFGGKKTFYCSHTSDAFMVPRGAVGAPNILYCGRVGVMRKTYMIALQKMFIALSI